MTRPTTDTAREPDMFDGGAFGSLIAFLISGGYQRVETLNPDARYRYYTQCRLCGRTDEAREHYKTSSELVEHNEVCTLAHFLPHLRALAETGILPPDAQPKPEPSDLEAARALMVEARESCGIYHVTIAGHIAAALTAARQAGAQAEREGRDELVAALREALIGVEALLDRPTDHDMNSAQEKREIRAAYQAGNRALDAIRAALAKVDTP